MRRMRAPAAATSATRSVVAWAVEDHGGEVADRLALRLGDGTEVLGRGPRDVDGADAVGPAAIFSM
jgi:hypothetical protein